MQSGFLKKALTVAAVLIGVWLGVKYLLPVALPFLLGGLLALAAEPFVVRAERRMKRSIAAGLGVTAALALVAGAVYLLGAVAVQQVASAARAIPDWADTASQAMGAAEDFFVSLAQRLPEQAQPVAQRLVLDFFDGSSVVIRQVGQHLPSVVGKTVNGVSQLALVVGTGILAAFLISARLPKLKEKLSQLLPEEHRRKWQDALFRVKKSLGGWLKAQLKLMSITFGILTVGFWLLRIPYGLMWALLIALVDAVPVLGTGTVLVPWALVRLFQGDSLQGIGLLCVYGAAALVRTVLEPRLVGHQLGLDPLATLGALYVGYRFWGFFGMIITPLLASAALQVLQKPAQR